MKIALVVFVIAGIYLAIGTLLGRRDVLYFLAAQRREWPHLRHDSESLRGEAAGWWALWIFFWPWMFIATRISRLLQREAQRVDPVAKEAELAARERRIKELEIELGIK